MEQTIAFLLGVLAVVALAGVYNTFRSIVQISDLREELKGQQETTNDLYREIDRVRELLDRRIDQEIDRLNRTENKLYEHANKLNSEQCVSIDKLYGHIDSRIDKLADGVSKYIADINAKLNDNTAFVDKLHHSIVDINGKLDPVRLDPAI